MPIIGVFKGFVDVIRHVSGIVQRRVVRKVLFDPIILVSYLQAEWELCP